MTYRAVIEVDGDSLHQIARRLEDIAFRLQEKDRGVPVEIVGGNHIVTVRPEADAPKVTWKP